MKSGWLLTCFVLTTCSAFAAEEALKPRKPCTVQSPKHLDFDLSGLSVLPKTEGQKSTKGARNESWMAIGYDSGVNYTINICAPVIEDIKDVEGVDESKWQNISAFYTSESGKTFSLGMQHSEFVFRGRKLVLHYQDGSPCGGGNSASELADGDSKNTRRKSMMISFLCDQDSFESSKPNMALSFVGASPDFCHYGFEARTPLACGGSIAPTEQAVGPGSLFGIM
ncbi:MAG: hypothetical protein GOMPHAMPRED_006974 [Gomphillus americanus]|uniref:MRH domain-containing protein n=1 Tax=Gomphillus americanus TaxID=1940652 RepID=A0A8H3ERM1_9LECA|nr:MAG: hypothetical protein GOMPHAMPRED_006974 [Gomphillus americanus]